MRQVPIPEDEYPRPSQFIAEKPYHHVITPGYKPYKEACEHASKGALGMMNEEKIKGTFNPATFVTDVWQKSAAYQKTDRLWEVYKREARIKLGEIAREDIKDALAA